MASYKNTEAGQLQKTLNAISQKWRRKCVKADALKEKIQKMKNSALEQELSKINAVKLSGMQAELKHTLAEVASLSDEMRVLKEMKEEKSKKKKQQQGEIFNAAVGDDAPKSADKSAEDCNDYLSALYGVKVPDNNVLNFNQL